jgi:transposase-like protein
MNENSEVLGRLVVGHKRDGRCQYDPAAKQELIRQCKQPGVSVSRIAMQHGVNANLLRSWIAKSLLVPDGKDVQQTNQTKKPDALPAFVAVQIEPSATPALTGQTERAERAERVPRSVPTAPSLRLHVRLPNGVALDIDSARTDELLPIMQLLSTLPCSS